MQDQIDQINDRLDENDQSFQEFSDQLDDTFSQTQDTSDDHEQRISDLEANSGQLSFPLTQDSIDLIKEQFPCGFATLVAGTVTILDPRISTTSNIFLTVATPGGTRGFLSYAAASGSVIITSTAAGETSVISYVIFN